MLRLRRLIEDLQSLGINVSDIKKLQDAGIHTIGGENSRSCTVTNIIGDHILINCLFLIAVLQASSRDLIAIKGLSDVKVDKVV